MDRDFSQITTRLRQQTARSLDKMQWIAAGTFGLLALSLAVHIPPLSLLIVNVVLGGLFLATYAFNLKHPQWQWLIGMLAPFSSH